MTAKTLSSEYINQHPYFTARRVSYMLEDGKKVDPYFVVDLPPCVLAMAITAEGEVLLVRQYRYPVNESLIELPGGFIDEGEDKEKAIGRELLEETGYHFESFHYLGAAAANPGVLNNFTHFFIALQGKKIKEQELDPNEQIEILLKPLDEVKELLLNFQIKQSLHALCLFYGFDYIEKKKLLG
jgi:8-oxo-dGTP pyrophosphatase MutT (NUDIX family)